MSYAPSELNINSDQPLVSVYRSPREVFDPDSIRSYNGISVTDEHPKTGFLNSSNTSWLSRGHVADARRDGEFVTATLVITDPTLISKVLSGTRELSAGYDFTLMCGQCERLAPDCLCREPVLAMANIRANHCAVVAQSRCGAQCCITDSAPPGLRRDSFATLCAEYSATLRAAGAAMRKQYVR